MAETSYGTNQTLVHIADNIISGVTKAEMYLEKTIKIDTDVLL